MIRECTTARRAGLFEHAMRNRMLREVSLARIAQIGLVHRSLPIHPQPVDDWKTSSGVAVSRRPELRQT